MKTQQDKFLTELVRLFDKYSVSIDGFHSYDNDENYTGTAYVLRGEEIYIPADELKNELAKTKEAMCKSDQQK